MPGLNLDLSVAGRRQADVVQVISDLESDGFSPTDSVLNDRIHRLEGEDGERVRVVEGAMATWVLPSGPLGGSILGGGSMSSAASQSSNDDSDEELADISGRTRGSSANQQFNV